MKSYHGKNQTTKTTTRSGHDDADPLRRFALPERQAVGGPKCWLISDLAKSDAPEGGKSASARELLQWCFETLAASPAAAAMIREAVQEGWAAGLDELGGYDFHLDVPEKKIVLNTDGISAGAITRSAYFRYGLLISLIRALRDAWQEKRHGGFDEEYGPDAIMMLERVRAADCDVMSVLVSWELRSDSYPGLWRHLVGSDEGDVAMAFSRKLERDPASLFNGRALAEAFRQWYSNTSRVNACDHETLNYLDKVVSERQGERIFGSKILTPVGIEVLSCLPDKSAYLKGQGENILRDPLYAGLGDTVNQSHYMQIIYDLSVTRVQDVPFRDPALAEKIFPGGKFSE